MATMPALNKPAGLKRPEAAAFLQWDDQRIVVSQYNAYNNADLEFVEKENMPTSNGDATTYTGYIKAGDSKKEKHGPGVIVYKSGDEYQGEFKDGLKAGVGQFTYKSNGSIYQGEWVADLKEGKGLQTWTTGSKYDGMFKNNQFHGKALYTMDSGETDEGNWIAGKR